MAWTTLVTLAALIAFHTWTMSSAQVALLRHRSFTVAITVLTAFVVVIRPSTWLACLAGRSLGQRRTNTTSSVWIAYMPWLVTRKTFFENKNNILEDYRSAVDADNILVHPLGENPQYPTKHLSHETPPIPGLQRHWPVLSSQSSL